MAHRHSCMSNVCDNNVYQAQTCTLFYYQIASTDKFTGWWHYESTLKDVLPDPRGCLANHIPSRAIEQANQEVWQDNHHAQLTPVKHIVISVYLNSVCYLISYTRLFTKLNLFEILLYITFITMKVSRSTVLLCTYVPMALLLFVGKFCARIITIECLSTGKVE